ncbi:covalently-linked cell wall protein [Phlyctema vagabunda]|uniref:Covalently-linked cell wall protein n=1 Tax=Phlyctema vagabunda TaxID=108571 RepID=A0ABR4PHB7_9HELO
MQTTFALAALAAVAFARPQGVTEDIAPSSAPPAGFETTYPGTFQITAVNITSVSKRDLTKRLACSDDASLTITLNNGVLKDAKARTGYIAANYQFQFDGPAQTGAIYTAGWSAGANGSLALGGSAVFYQCLSGDFYNLYDRAWAPQCSPILIEILPCGSGTTTGAASQVADGQPQVTTAIAISELPDGQPQVPTGLPVTQIGDGQIQAPTATATPQAPVTQISDGQIQAPTSVKAPVTQIPDGQIQAPTSVATTAAVVTQIPDGQIQAPTKASTTAAVTQIPDGQIQAPTNATASATSTPVPFVGAASGLTVQAQFAAVVVGLAAVFLL